MTLQEQFGQIDIYLFDQILRGNIAPPMRVVDAGCGGGRNIQYLLREGFEVYGVDTSAEAVAAVRKMANELAPGLPPENFQVAAVEAMPFADEFADVVVCHSVLHFARDKAHLEAMVRGLWRVLRPGGMLFCRLATTIGAGQGMTFEALGGRRFRMSHGAEWLLMDEALLMELTRSLDGELVDPLKTTVVQGQRCMTTWVVKKKAPPGGAARAFVSSGMPARRLGLDARSSNRAYRGLLAGYSEGPGPALQTSGLPVILTEMPGRGFKKLPNELGEIFVLPVMRPKRALPKRKIHVHLSFYFYWLTI